MCIILHRPKQDIIILISNPWKYKNVWIMQKCRYFGEMYKSSARSISQIAETYIPAVIHLLTQGPVQARLLCQTCKNVGNVHRNDFDSENMFIKSSNYILQKHQ